MSAIKGFLRFISIILCVVILVYICNNDYRAQIITYTKLYSEYSELTTTAEGENYYTVYNGERYLFTGSITVPTEDSRSETVRGIEQYLKIEKMYTQSEGSYVLSFTGDCALGSLNEAGNTSRYYKYIKQSGESYPFENVSAFFKNDDYTFVNLECSLTTQTERAKKNMRIKGEPEWAQTVVAESGIEGVSLANNHTYDYREEGFNDTVEAVTAAGLDYSVQNYPIFKEVGGVPVVIITGNYVNDGITVGLRGKTLTQNICTLIKKYKTPGNIVIVFCHWGTETEEQPDEDQRNYAHEFIDSGADMVLGCHPHVLQGAEVYGGKYIFYSLGNFSFAGNSTVNAANKRSIIVRPRIALNQDNKAEITGVCVVPCYTTSATGVTNNFQPLPVFGTKAQDIGDYIIKISSKISGGVEELNIPSAQINSEQ